MTELWTIRVVSQLQKIIHSHIHNLTVYAFIQMQFLLMSFKASILPLFLSGVSLHTYMLGKVNFGLVYRLSQKSQTSLSWTCQVRFREWLRLRPKTWHMVKTSVKCQHCLPQKTGKKQKDVLKQTKKHNFKKHVIFIPRSNTWIKLCSSNNLTGDWYWI